MTMYEKLELLGVTTILTFVAFATVMFTVAALDDSSTATKAVAQTHVVHEYDPEDELLYIIQHYNGDVAAYLEDQRALDRYWDQ